MIHPELDAEIHKPPRRWPLAAILIGVFVVWAGSGLWISRVYPDEGERGQFGDMFGAVNALFSGLAFGCVVYAIFLQHRALEIQQRELALQRQELALQREELKLTRMEYSAQNKILAQQLELQREGRDPRFVPTGRVLPGDRPFGFHFENKGAPVIQVCLRSNAIKGDILQANDGSYMLRFVYRESEEPATYNFWLCFIRTDGTEGNQKFVVSPPGRPVPVPDDRDDIPY